MIYPTPVLVIGTYDEEGKPNAMTTAWGGICCSSPPCVAISLRKATYTYGNLMSKKAFTINIPSENYVREADLAWIERDLNLTLAEVEDAKYKTSEEELNRLEGESSARQDVKQRMCYPHTPKSWKSPL